MSLEGERGKSSGASSSPSPTAISQTARKSPLIEDLKGALEDIVRIGTIILTVLGIGGIVWWLSSLPNVTSEVLKSVVSGTSVAILLLAFVFLRLRRRLGTAIADSLSLRAEADSIQTILVREQSRSSDFEQRLGEAAASLIRMKEENATLSSQIQTERSERESLKQKGANLQERIGILEAELFRKDQSLSGFEQEASEAKTNLSGAQNEIRHLRETQAESARKAQAAEEETATLRLVPVTAERPIVVSSYSVVRPLLFGKSSHNLTIANRGKGAAVNVEVFLRFSGPTPRYPKGEATWSTEAIGSGENFVVEIGSDENLKGANRVSIRLVYKDKAGRGYESIWKTFSLD